MPTSRDYYEVLSVERTADGEEIKRAYRRLAMKHHPDRNPGDKEAETKFKEAAEAYEVLSDGERRKRYDQFGHDGVRGQGGYAPHDFSRMHADDIFSMFQDIFGGAAGGMGGVGRGAPGRGANRRGVARGYDLETEVVLDLKDVVTGCEREVEFTRLDVCEKCAGSGAKAGSKPAKCETCGGQGRVVQTGLGGMFRMETTCPHCVGRGQIVKDKCDGCHGKGRKPHKRRLSVKIPPGIHDQQAVRIVGEGEPPGPEVSPDGSGVRGDLHVVARVRGMEGFERDGDNLVTALPISFTQAALGAHVEAPAIDGPASLQVPKGTQHGAALRIQGGGLPNLRNGKRGDLIAVVEVVVPKRLSAKQEALLRELAELEGHGASTDTSAGGATQAPRNGEGSASGSTPGSTPGSSGRVWKKIKDAIGG